MKVYAVVICILLTSCLLAAQSPTACPATESAILAVQRASREAFIKHDFAAFARLIDDQAILSVDNGMRMTKSEMVETIRQEQQNNRTPAESNKIGDIVVRFTDGIAILNLAEHGVNTDLNVDVTSLWSSRQTYIFGCRAGEWKIIYRAEVPMPNATRPVDTSTQKNLDDYVGRYRFYQNGEAKGYVTVTRKGNSLIERWGKEDPSELLPGRFDTFFVRNDSTQERFVRDQTGKVIGIHYVIGNSDLEARRAE